MLEFITRKKKKGLIIFIHGFLGGRETWLGRGKTLLHYLKDDKTISSKYDFAVFDYFTRITDLTERAKYWLEFIFSMAPRLRRNLSITDISQLLGSEINEKCEEYERIVLVAHSMGGLVSKSYILERISQKPGGLHKLKSPVELYISLAVPHNGSELATLGCLIFRNPQLVNLKPLSNTIVALNKQWVQNAKKLPETAYFQGKNDVFVTEDSSAGYEAREVEIIYSDGDHSSIACPARADDVVIVAIKKRLRPREFSPKTKALIPKLDFVIANLGSEHGRLKAKLLRYRDNPKERLDDKHYEDVYQYFDNDLEIILDDIENIVALYQNNSKNGNAVRGTGNAFSGATETIIPDAPPPKITYGDWGGEAHDRGTKRNLAKTETNKTIGRSAPARRNDDEIEKKEFTRSQVNSIKSVLSSEALKNAIGSILNDFVSKSEFETKVKALERKYGDDQGLDQALNIFTGEWSRALKIESQSFIELQKDSRRKQA